MNPDLRAFADELEKRAAAGAARRIFLTETEADEVEAELRRLEADPTVSKNRLRLFMQTPMSCGHSTGCLLTCDRPPFGCVECNFAEDKPDLAHVTALLLRGCLARRESTEHWELCDDCRNMISNQQLCAEGRELAGTASYAEREALQAASELAERQGKE